MNGYDRYKQRVLNEIATELRAGAGVMVQKSGHWTRLQHIEEGRGTDEGHLMVSDPGGYGNAHHLLKWSEAQAGAYFKEIVILNG